MENSAFIGAVLFGLLGISLLSAVYGYVFLVFVLVTQFFALPRMVCSHCQAFGESCHNGRGLLFSRFFEKRNVEDFDKYMAWIGVPVWTVTFSIPIIGLVLLLLDGFTTFRFIVLFLYLSFLSGFGLLVGMFGCSRCSNREKCLVGQACPLPDKKEE